MSCENNSLPSLICTSPRNKLKPKSSVGANEFEKVVCTALTIFSICWQPGGKKSPTTSFSARTVVSWKASITRSRFSNDAAMAFSTSNTCSSVSILTCMAIACSQPPPSMPKSRQFPESRCIINPKSEQMCYNRFSPHERTRMVTRLNKIYHEFPRLFWVVVSVSFIDGIGGTLLFPFFALYITQKFGVGMTQAGILLGISSLFGLVGSMVGGALTDKFGRKQLILFGLVFSAISTLGFGLVNNFAILFPLVIVVGLLSSVARPAHEAMIADILPEKQRQEGFGILRVVANLAWIIGPTIGGFLANINFFYLFVIDSIICCYVAGIIYRYIPYPQPAPHV